MANKNSLLALYKDRSDYANYLTSEMWKLAPFFTTTIIAMITIPLALSGSSVVDDLSLLSFFPFIGIVLSLSGIIVLLHQSRGFYKTLYALSIIRKTLVKDFKALFKNANVDTNDDSAIAKEFNEIGILHVDFKKYPTLRCYLRDNVFRWRPFSIRTVIYILYGIFVVINILLIYLFLTIK